MEPFDVNGQDVKELIHNEIQDNADNIFLFHLFLSLDSLRRICFRIPTSSSSTLCCIPLDVSMNLQSLEIASDFPSKIRKTNPNTIDSDTIGRRVEWCPILHKCRRVVTITGSGLAASD
ncbi:hypothetical protein QE152_g23683 [Popillia japonica]|uniref:Uncharacterized protein n=1 Tax=Popillia japonica TaxID=7064 RepID=A0AAW1KGJ6_POPJA